MSLYDTRLAEGKSAYEYAVDSGYEGTEEEFGSLLGTLDTTLNDINDELDTKANQTDLDSLTTEVTDLKKSVADGKSLLATTISDYGYTTVASDASFEEINTAIETTAESLRLESTIEDANEEVY